MPGNKKVNSNLNIDGKISVSTVPNLGTTATYILTQNSSTKEISQRTGSEIISDFGIASNSWVSSNYIPKTHPVYNITRDLIDYWAFKDGTNATGNWGNTSDGLAQNPTIPGKHKNTSGDTSLANATYGQGMGYINTASTSNGNPLDAWFYRLKFLHNNPGGYYGEFAIQMTDGNSAWYKRYENGTDSGWIRLLDTTNGVTLNTTQTITGHKVFKALGNSYDLSSIEAYGNGSDIFPSVGFHQPNVNASYLYQSNDGWLNLKSHYLNNNYTHLRLGEIQVNNRLDLQGSQINAPNIISFLNNGSAQGIKIGNLTVSGTYGDSAPAYGILSKGLNFLNARPEYSGTPTISLAIGDYDTGFNWIADGNIGYYSNGIPLYSLNDVHNYKSGIKSFTAEKDGLRGSEYEQILNINFANATNQAIDIIFPNYELWGSLEVEVTTHYIYANSPGNVKNIFTLGLNADGVTKYTTGNRIIESLQPTSNSIKIDDIISKNGHFVLPIRCINDALNKYIVKLRLLTPSTYSKYDKLFSL